MESAGSRLEITQAVRAILEQRSAAKRGLLVPMAGPVSNLAGIALLSLAPAAVTAVGLGEIQPQSSLGEPLRASVPLSLASGESVRPGCITVPPKQQSDLRQPANATVTTPLASGPGVLQLGVSTTRPLYEPMYELTLRVDCPGIPTVLRHYVLMLDLPGMGAITQAGNQNDNARAPLTVPAAVTSPSQRRPAPTAGRTLASSGKAIAAGSNYRVREGDTLSTIAARIEGRPADSTWALADWIFTANPTAFIRNNPDLIKLGTIIALPAAADWNGTGAPAARSQTLSTTVPAVTTPSPLPVPVPVQSALEVVTPREFNSPATEPASPVTTVMPTELVTTPSIAADSRAAEMTVATTPASPFADEAPTSEPAEVRQVIEPPPVVLTQRQTTSVSPLLAVLLGVLLGFGLSILLLRARLLEGLTSLFARGRAEPAQSPAETTYADTDEWLKTEVTSLEAKPVSLGTPAEETYVVEVDNAEQHAAADQSDDIASDDDSLDNADPAVETTGFAAPFDSFSDHDANNAPEPELAELFADDLADLADLSAETDLPEEVFADAGDLDVNSLAPTAEMPEFGQSGAVMDQTLESPTAELGALPADTDATADLDLQGLADSQGDETRLSDTLQEALTLLEKDFENELTASQIIDQSAIKQALEEEEDFDPAPQKRAG